jgi:hypothetical protein
MPTAYNTLISAISAGLVAALGTGLMMVWRLKADRAEVLRSVTDMHALIGALASRVTTVAEHVADEKVDLEEIKRDVKEIARHIRWNNGEKGEA